MGKQDPLTPTLVLSDCPLQSDYTFFEQTPVLKKHTRNPQYCFIDYTAQQTL